MTRLTSTAFGLVVAGLVLAACATPQKVEHQSDLDSETGCLTAADSFACKFEQLKAGGPNIVLPQGAGDGKRGHR